jgi:hypothetical protein
MNRSILMTAIIFGQYLAASAYAGDYLDPAYPNLKHPIVNDAPLASKAFHGFDQFGNLDQPVVAAPTKSDTVTLINRITPIRDQAARGTCSIFSSTAMFEAMMIIRGEADKSLDLSEEWLEYIVTRVSGHEGSTSSVNFDALLSSGEVPEATMPYIGETWTDVSSAPLAQARCGKLSGNDLSDCLIGHWDPNLMTTSLADLGDANNPIHDLDFLAAKKAAAASQPKLHVTDRNYDMDNTSDIKALLRQGIPVSVELTFYYGAWNHEGGVALGMTRNMSDWAKGIVFYPEIGSIDRDRSPEQPDGHSVLIVGYDDNVTLTKAVQMTDGTTQTFTRKGVYYFKNSWGTDNFGPLAMIDGQSEPGYGTITQDYANEFGQFFQLSLK